MVKKKKASDKKHFVFAGIAGGATGVLCCVAPVVLVLLGLGAALGMMVMHHFHTISIVSGVIFMILLSLYLVKREHGVCNIRTVKKSWQQLALAAVVMVVSLFAINYLVVYPAAAVVYGNLEVEQKPMGNLADMGEMHGMEMHMEIVPEGKGIKQVMLEIEGLFCGSCGPAIEYDLKSIEGVVDTEKKGISKMIVTYDSDVTSKDVIVAAVHDPYSATIVEEQCKLKEAVETAEFGAC